MTEQPVSLTDPNTVNLEVTNSTTIFYLLPFSSCKCTVLNQQFRYMYAVNVLSGSYVWYIVYKSPGAGVQKGSEHTCIATFLA